jgi:hypothetical protein
MMDWPRLIGWSAFVIDMNERPKSGRRNLAAGGRVWVGLHIDSMGRSPEYLTSVPLISARAGISGAGLGADRDLYAC